MLGWINFRTLPSKGFAVQLVYICQSTFQTASGNVFHISKLLTDKDRKSVV